MVVEGIPFVDGESTLELSPKVPSVEESAPLARSNARRATEIRPIFFPLEKNFRKVMARSSFRRL